MSNEYWIILTACLVGITCATSGSLLVVRRMAMLGDAISHSVLFGIVVAFLISESRGLPVLIGASAVGLLTAFLTDALHRHARVAEDASIGVVFTLLFALGIALLSVFAGQVDLDQDCVLHGEIALIPFDLLTLPIIGEIPRAVFSLGCVAAANLLFFLLFSRRLTATAFDSAFLKAIGVRTNYWHYAMMAMVSISIVAAFEAVGAILVIAMLTVPPASALLFARSVKMMVLLAAIFSAIAAVGGFQLAAYFDGSIAAAVAIVAGAIFFLAVAINIVRQKHGARLSSATIKFKNGAIKQ